MVTCKLDTVAVPKMSSVRRHKHLSHTSPTTNSNSSVQRLLTDGSGDQIESSSSVSHNSIYKLKIDLMFDDTRLIRNNRLDDPRGSHRTRSIIMYGRSELASTAGARSRSITSILQDSNNADPGRILTESTKKDVRRVSNSVQAQIEQLFTDVAKDATSSFAVTCLGSLPLKDKVTSLQGLQVPLRELYMRELITERRKSGSLDICATGLRVKINGSAMVTNSSNKNSIDNNSNNGNNNTNTNNNCNDTSIIPAKCGNDTNNSNAAVSDNYNHNYNYNDGNITPFHNIAVWSAVKFVISEDDGGAAFLPLITDPENIDKSMLFQPLNSLEEKRVASNKHAPIFAVVMRSSGVPKVLECHGFICRSTEDAIVIAATLYQSLMAHVNANSQCSTKRRAPRNQNGVSCISIASSTAQTGSNYLTRSQLVSAERKSSSRNSNASIRSANVCPNSNMGSRNASSSSMVMRSVRKKRISTSSLSCSSQVINEASETTTEERKRRSHKTKRAPPIPGSTHTHGVDASSPTSPTSIPGVTNSAALCSQQSFSKEPPLSSLCAGNSSSRSNNNRMPSHHVYTPVGHNHPKAKSKHPTHTISRASEMIVSKTAPTAKSACNESGVGVMMRSETNGDILTRVAIPRSGSFLNTGGLTRYKSRGIRRQSNKPDACEGDCGSSGGTPLGFSELFNEFRLHENLHSLDEILYAIIDADGMSFNDLKPIYKEFLLKLAVTLTKDELYQRSKNIMRRQKKKKLNHQIGNAGPQRRPRILLFGTKGLKKVFHLDQFRSCRGKSSKPSRHKNHFAETKAERKSGAQLVIGPPMAITQQHHQQQQQQLLPQKQRNRIATSGSEVSAPRHENGFNGLNRNSSSGYVSCSEYSYDSEACTCAPAERCYCSLRNERLSHRQRRNNTLNGTPNSTVMQKPARETRQKQNGNIRRQQQPKEISSSTPDSRRSARNNRSSASSSSNTNTTNNNNNNVNRLSLISCKSDEKCYCSMVEDDTVHDDVESINEDEIEDAEESTNTHSDTTWCDTDSCISTSKCYCQRERRSSRNRSTPLSGHDHHHDHHDHERTPRSSSRQRQSSERSSRSQHSNKPTNEKLALDYELFTINGNRKSMPPYEALSMKKSVEAAAVFADVKLRQTTDIKSVCSSTTTPTSSSTPPTPLTHTPSRRSDSVSNTSRASSRKQQYEIHRSSNNSNSNNGHNRQRCESQCSDHKDDRHKSQIVASPPGISSMKSYSADDLLKKLDSVETVVGSVGSSVRSCSVSKQSDRNFHHFSARERSFANIKNGYQPIKAVSASLEDTLGYLP